MTTSSMYRLMLPLLAVVALVIPAYSQSDKVVIILHTPPPTLLHVEMLWKIDLINSGGPRAIRLYGVAFESRSGRWIANGLSDVFDAPAGFSSVDPAQIGPIDYDGDAEYDDIVTRTGRVPTGEYTICVYVIDDRTRDTLGRNCITDHVALNVLPPQLIYPSDSRTITEPHPLFTWTPPSPMVSEIEITYRLRIVEIVGRQSPFAAMESNPSWFDEYDLPVPLCPYPLAAIPFEAGTAYAWQVIAYAQTGEGREGELTRSEVWMFAMAPDTSGGFTGSTEESASNGDIVTDKNSDVPPEIDVVDQPTEDDGSVTPTTSDTDSIPTEVIKNAGHPVPPTVSATEISSDEKAVATRGDIPAPAERKGDTSISPNGVYGTLTRKLDSGYYNAVGYLRFKYDNDNGSTEITCRIYDDASRDVTPRDLRLRVAAGRSYHSIDLRKATRLREGEIYRFVVTDSAGRKLQCRFALQFCPTCPDPLPPDKQRE